MRKLFIRVLLSILTISLSLSASGPRVTANLFEEIDNEIVAVDTPPLYSNTTQDGGMLFEIVLAALTSENETAMLTTYPVKKMVHYYITQEQTLAALGINFTFSKAEKKDIISVPLAFIEESYIYYKPAHPNGLTFTKKLSDLQGMTYGADNGEDITTHKEAGIAVIHGESRFLFKKLKSQKVDYIKESTLSSHVMLNTNFSKDRDDFMLVPSKEEKSLSMIHFNRKNDNAQEIAKKFRKGLLTIIKSGLYQDIMQKYEANSDAKDITKLQDLLRAL